MLTRFTQMNLHLKLGNPIGSGFTFEFSDDTGADFMTLYRDDLFCMYNADKFCLEDCLDPGTKGNLEFIVPVLGVIQSWLGDGSSAFSYVAIVGMNLEHPNPDLANDGLPWREDYLPVETLVRDGNIETGLAPRLNGPAIRILYPTVSSNTDSLRLYVVSSLEKASREYVKHMSDNLEGSGKKIPSLQHKMLEKEVGTTSQIPKGAVHGM